MMRLILLILLGLLLPWQNSTAGGTGWRDNLQRLPSYCTDRAEKNYAKLRPNFGDVSIHLHHYCKGIYAEQQAKIAADKRKRSDLLGRVAHQMRYVSDACKENCILYPELHSRWGWALGEQSQYAEAIKHFQLAIRVKPTYSTAYAMLSDLYVKMGEPDEARKALESGLKARPRSRKLKRRLQKLK